MMVSASATNVDLPTVVPNSKSFHRVLPDDDAQAAGVVEVPRRRSSKPEKIAIVHDNSEYGKGLAVDQFAAQLQATIERRRAPRPSTPRARTTRPP